MAEDLGWGLVNLFHRAVMRKSSAVDRATNEVCPATLIWPDRVSSGRIFAALMWAGFALLMPICFAVRRQSVQIRKARYRLASGVEHGCAYRRQHPSDDPADIL